ncbi:hypothetical protein [Acetivibrio straminisolvens]|jgi:hypothetical protein|nr:hypothetical protein [Acetivibrio straminisolvens]
MTRKEQIERLKEISQRSMERALNNENNPIATELDAMEILWILEE